MRFVSSQILFLSIFLTILLLPPATSAQDGRQESSFQLPKKMVDIDPQSRCHEEAPEECEITFLPPPEPAQVSIGTYWSCFYDENEFEICDLVTVFCDDDGNCVSTNTDPDLNPDCPYVSDLASVSGPDVQPLRVGIHWSCFSNEQDLEICRLKLVVCPQNGRCFEVN